MQDDLIALAERCEAAEGPDRELDGVIATAIGLPDRHNIKNGMIINDFGFGAPLAAYTASLDAAMTLLNDTGVLMALSDIGADGLPLARVARPDLDEAPIFSGIASCIMTDTAPLAGLAIALCAAALRARAAMGGGDEQH